MARAMAVAEDGRLAHINPTARKALYRPSKHLPAAAKG